MKTRPALPIANPTTPATLAILAGLSALSWPAAAATNPATETAPSAVDAAAFKQWQTQCRENRGTDCDSVEAFLAETVAPPRRAPHKPAAGAKPPVNPAPTTPPGNPTPSKEPARK